MSTTFLALTLPIQQPKLFFRLSKIAEALLPQREVLVKKGSETISPDATLTAIASHIYSTLATSRGRAFRKAFEVVWLRKVKKSERVRDLLNSLRTELPEKEIIRFLFSPEFVKNVGEAEKVYESRKDFIQENLVPGKSVSNYTVVGDKEKDYLKLSIVIVGDKSSALKEITKALKTVLYAKGFSSSSQGLREISLDVLSTGFTLNSQNKNFFNPHTLEFSYSSSKKNFGDIKNTVTNFAKNALQDVAKEYSYAIKADKKERLIKPNYLKLNDEARLNRLEGLFIKEILGLNKTKRDLETSSELFKPELKDTVLNAENALREARGNSILGSFQKLGLSQENFTDTGEKVYGIFLEILRGEFLNEDELTFLRNYKRLNLFMSKAVSGELEKLDDDTLEQTLEELDKLNLLKNTKLLRERKKLEKDLEALEKAKKNELKSLNEYFSSLEYTAEDEEERPLLESRLKPMQDKTQLFKIPTAKTPARIKELKNLITNASLKVNLPPINRDNIIDLKNYAVIREGGELAALVVFEKRVQVKAERLVKTSAKEENTGSNSGFFKVRGVNLDGVRGLKAWDNRKKEELHITNAEKNVVGLASLTPLNYDDIYVSYLTEEEEYVKLTKVSTPSDMFTVSQNVAELKSGLSTLNPIEITDTENNETFSVSDAYVSGNKISLRKYPQLFGKTGLILSYRLQSPSKAALNEHVTSLLKMYEKAYNLKTSQKASEGIKDFKKLLLKSRSDSGSAVEILDTLKGLIDEIVKKKFEMDKLDSSAVDQLNQFEIKSREKAKDSLVSLKNRRGDYALYKKYLEGFVDAGDVHEEYKEFENIMERISPSFAFSKSFTSTDKTIGEEDFTVLDTMAGETLDAENAITSTDYIKRFMNNAKSDPEKRFLNLLKRHVERNFSPRQSVLSLDKDLLSRFCADSGLEEDEANKILEALDKLKKSGDIPLESKVIDLLNGMAKGGVDAANWLQKKLEEPEKSDADIISDIDSESDIYTIKANVIEGLVLAACSESLKNGISVSILQKELRSMLSPFTGKRSPEGEDDSSAVVSRLFPTVMWNMSKMKKIYENLDKNNKNVLHLIQDVFLDRQAILPDKSADNEYLSRLQNFANLLVDALKASKENLGSIQANAEVWLTSLRESLEKEKENLKKQENALKASLEIKDSDLDLVKDYSAFNLVVQFSRELESGTSVALRYKVKEGSAVKVASTPTDMLESILDKKTSIVYFPCPENLGSSLSEIEVILNQKTVSPYEIVEAGVDEKLFDKDFKKYMDKLVKSRERLEKTVEETREPYEKKLEELKSKRFTQEKMQDLTKKISPKNKGLSGSLAEYKSSEDQSLSFLASLPGIRELNLSEKELQILKEVYDSLDGTPKKADALLIRARLKERMGDSEKEIEVLRESPEYTAHLKARNELALAKEALNNPLGVVGFKEKIVEEKKLRANLQEKEAILNNVLRKFSNEQAKSGKKLDKYDISFLENLYEGSPDNLLEMDQEDLDAYFVEVANSLEEMSRTYSVIILEESISQVNLEIRELKKEGKRVSKKAQDAPREEKNSLIEEAKTIEKKLKTLEIQKGKLEKEKKLKREEAPYKEHEKYKAHLKTLIRVMGYDADKIMALRLELSAARNNYNPALIKKIKDTMSIFNSFSSVSGQIGLANKSLRKDLTLESVSKRVAEIQKQVKKRFVAKDATNIEKDVLKALEDKALAYQKWFTAQKELDSYKNFRYIPTKNMGKEQKSLIDTLIDNINADKINLSKRKKELENKLKKASLARNLLEKGFSGIVTASPETLEEFSERLSRELSSIDNQLESLDEALTRYIAERNYLKGNRKRFYTISLTGEVSDFSYGYLRNSKNLSGEEFKALLKKTQKYREFLEVSKSIISEKEQEVAQAESRMANLGKLSGEIEGDLNVEALSDLIRYKDSPLYEHIVERVQNKNKSLKPEYIASRALLLLKEFPSLDKLSNIGELAKEKVAKNGFTRTRIYGDRLSANAVMDEAIGIGTALGKVVADKGSVIRYSSVDGGKHKTYDQIVSEGLAKQVNFLKGRLEEINPAFEKLENFDATNIRSFALSLDSKAQTKVEDVLKRYRHLFKKGKLSVDAFAESLDLSKDKKGSYYKEENHRLNQLFEFLDLGKEEREARKKRRDELQVILTGKEKSEADEDLLFYRKTLLREKKSLKAKIKALELANVDEESAKNKEDLLKRQDQVNEFEMLVESCEMSYRASALKTSLKNLLLSDRILKDNKAEALLLNITGWIADNKLSKLTPEQNNLVVKKLKKFFLSAQEQVKRSLESAKSLNTEIRGVLTLLVNNNGGIEGLSENFGKSNNEEQLKLEAELKKLVSSLGTTAEKVLGEQLQDSMKKNPLYAEDFKNAEKKLSLAKQVLAEAPKLVLAIDAFNPPSEEKEHTNPLPLSGNDTVRVLDNETKEDIVLANFLSLVKFIEDVTYRKKYPGDPSPYNLPKSIADIKDKSALISLRKSWDLRNSDDRDIAKLSAEEKKKLFEDEVNRRLSRIKSNRMEYYDKKVEGLLANSDFRNKATKIFNAFKEVIDKNPEKLTEVHLEAMNKIRPYVLIKT